MKIKILFAAFLLATSSAFAQVPRDSELYKTIKKADSLLFELGFNQCRLTEIEKFVHPDLRFLHDVGGMQNREEFFTAMKNNICSQTEHKAIRKLVPGSFEVYPLYSNGKLYGAIQIGVHEFYISEKGKPLQKTGIAKFTHSWLQENGEWKLYQVLSYDHQAAK